MTPSEALGGGAMSAPHMTVWHLVGVALLVAGVLGAIWFSLWILWIGGRK